MNAHILREFVVSKVTNATKFIDLFELSDEFARQYGIERPVCLEPRIQAFFKEQTGDWSRIKENIRICHALRIAAEWMQQNLLKIGKIVKFDDDYCIEQFLSFDGTLKLGEPTPDAMIDFINQMCQKYEENGVDPNYAMKDLPLAYAQWRLPSPIDPDVLSKKFKELGPHILASEYSDAKKVKMLLLAGLPVEESFVESVPSTPSGGADDDREERSTPEERAQSAQDSWAEQGNSRKRAAADETNQHLSPKRAVSQKAGPSGAPIFDVSSRSSSTVSHIKSTTILEVLFKAMAYMDPSPGREAIMSKIQNVNVANDKVVTVDIVFRTLPLCISLVTTKTGRPALSSTDVPIEKMVNFLEMFRVLLEQELGREFVEQTTKYQSSEHGQLPFHVFELAVDNIIDMC